MCFFSQKAAFLPSTCKLTVGVIRFSEKKQLETSVEVRDG